MGQAAFGLTINEFYGQTECNLVLGSCAQLGMLKPGAIGKPVPGHVVAVIGRDGALLKAGELGQIAVKRPDPVMFLEYWGKPEATREKFIGDWMVTGDQGVMDDDGYISFRRPRRRRDLVGRLPHRAGRDRGLPDPPSGGGARRRGRQAGCACAARSSRPSSC